MPEQQEADATGLAGAAPALRGPWKAGGPIARLGSAPQGPVTVRKVLTLATPAIAEQVLVGIIGLTDTVIAGHLPGNANTIASAAAAVGLMSYLQWFAGLMTNALGVGATAIVARSIGARRPRVANRVAGTSVAAAFVVSILTSAALFIFSRQIVWLCGLRDLAALFAVQYLRIMVVTISLQTTAQIGMACLRGAGDTVRPMVLMAMVMLVNGLFSFTFAFGWFGMPAWGVRGDAFGTLLAYLAGGASAIIILFFSNSVLRIRLRHLKIVPHVLMRVLRIGMPSFMEGMLLWSGQFLIVMFVINVNSDPYGYTMAAHSAVLRVESMAFLPGFGFGIAASALVGQYLGANLPRQAWRAAWIATTMALVTMTVIAIPMVFFPRWMLGLIVNSPPVIAVGAWPMVLAGLAQPGFAGAIGLGAALRGAGETVWPMVATVSGTFGVRLAVLAVALLVLKHVGYTYANLTAVWIAIFMDLNYRAVVCLVIFLKGRWQRKKV